MTSHTKFGGIELSVGKGGIRFKKRKSAYNVCIANIMTGVPNTKGRYDTDFQKAFVQASHDCGAKLKPATKKKYGIAGTKGTKK